MLKLKVKWLEHLLGDEWKISPAGGLTGDAYFAQNEGKKLFLKRNSSPFFGSSFSGRHRAEACLDKAAGKWGCNHCPALDKCPGTKAQ